MYFLYRIPVLRKFILLNQNFIFNFIYRRKLENKVNIFGFPIISIKKGADIQIGKNLTMISNSFFSEIGVDHPVIIRLLNKNSKLRIDNNVGISGGSICVGKEVVIENEVMLGANVLIADTDFHSVEPYNRRYRKDGVMSEKIVIKKNVFIGINTLILKGVTVGENSVVGAGSIVTNNIPPNVIAAGNPCKVIREINHYELQCL
jgi:acetyltransferase-like isoleucine patch superfamily enzyme